MTVKCITNKSKNLPEVYLDTMAGFTVNTEFDLSLDKIYPVFGISIRDGQIFYYLCGDVHPYYPVTYPAPLFEIVNDLLPDFWHYRFFSKNPDHQVLITFKEWIDNQFFYDKLTDLERSALEIFKQYKEKVY